MTRNDNNFWNFPLDQISHTFTLIVSCLEWLTCLFVFTMVEFEKVLYSLDCKTVGFSLKITKEIGKAWRKSLTRAKRASLRPLCEFDTLGN